MVDPSGRRRCEVRPTGTTRVDYYRAGSAASPLPRSSDGLIGEAEISRQRHHRRRHRPHGAARVAAKRAVAAGTTVSSDVNHRSLGPAEHSAVSREDVLEQVDVLFGGTEELALLAPQVDGSDARALLTALARPGREVVAKLGPDGAAALVDGRLHEAAGHRVDVVDTVGAGDAFVAGYLSARLDGQDVAGRLERANACGALACTAPGDWEGAPDGAALEAFLHGGEADPVSR